jgi:hypothetical protein
LVAERQQLVQSPYLARQCAYAVIYVTRLLLVREEESEEGKVATSYTDRGLLAEDGRAGLEAAVVDHGIRNPYFFLSLRLRVGWCVCRRGR